jgi:hypothetical protein
VLNDVRGDMCSRDVHRCSMIVGDMCSRDVHRCSGMCVVIGNSRIGDRGSRDMRGDMCSRDVHRCSMMCIDAQ